MTAKQRSLAESRRQRTKAAVDFQASDSAKFWMLSALNQSIPAMSHIVDHSTTAERGVPAPGHAHRAALHLRGRRRPDDHSQVQFPRARRRLRAHVRARAHAARRGPRRALRRDPAQQARRRHVPRPDPRRRADALLALRGGDGRQRARGAAPRPHAQAGQDRVVGADRRHPQLGRQRHPPRARVHAPVASLPVKPGLVFFKVVRTPEYWNDIAGTGTIAIYQPIDPLGVDIHLYAVDPTNLQ